jgi:hypothetical protein
MEDVGRDVGDLEIVGGTRGWFPEPTATANLDDTLASIPEQLDRGCTTICVKPSQFTDDTREIPALLARIVERIESIAAAVRR